MNFKTFDELKFWLKIHKGCNFAGGGQGECYRIGNQVFKIFIQYIDEDEMDTIVYDRDNILQFSSITNNTYIWPQDVITVGNIVVGYITEYVDANSLYKMNPLYVNLDDVERCLIDVMRDIRIISDNGVLTFDVAYNILYGNCGFKVIDSMEYSMVDIDSMDLYRINMDRFNYEIRLFLIDGYFDEFIDSNKYLFSMCYDSNVSFIDFLREFRKQLSEKEECKINRLGDAKNSMVIRKRKIPRYIRELCV